VGSEMCIRDSNHGKPIALAAPDRIIPTVAAVAEAVQAPALHPAD